MVAQDPFGFWREATDAERVAIVNRPLSGHWLDEFAQIYRTMALAGLPDPRRVDNLAMWEIAAVLGLNDAIPEDESPREDGVQMFNIRRAIAMQEGRPVPDFDTPYEPGERERLRALIDGGSAGGFLARIK